MSFIEVLITVFTLIILAVPGIILAKLKMLPEKATKVLTTVLLFVCQPALTFMSFQKTEYTDNILKSILIVTGFAFLAHIIMIVFSMLVIRNKKKDVNLNVTRFASVFGNVGYMGLPFLQSLFPDAGEILIYGAVVIAVFNFLSWTIGIYMITGDKKFISLKKAVLNPPFIALIISLPLFIIFKKPIASVGSGTLNIFLSKLMASVNMFGEMVTPVAMFILGVRLSEMNLKSIFLNKLAYVSATIKLVVCPIVVILLVLPFSGLAINIKYAMLFTMAMPTATSTLLFSEQYGGEPHTSSAIVLLSTIISVITIPLAYLLFSVVIG